MLGTPVVVWSTMPEVIEHPFITRMAARVCSTFDEAMDYLEFLLVKKLIHTEFIEMEHQL